MSKEYYLGLDLGTNSVGWAVTDPQYHLLRAKGKDLWGVREFDEANVAIERRQHRTSRRYRQREQVRNGLIRDYFSDAIQKVDPNFFQRLDNSKFWLEDKDEAVRTPNGVFNDKDYKDKDYYAQYPTIFHLRRELIRNPEPHDVRLVYLAVSNMFKHRGHFLTPSLDVENAGSDLRQTYELLSATLSETTDIVLPANLNPDELIGIFGNSELSRTVKAEKAAELLTFEKKDKSGRSLVKLMCGLKVDLRTIFGDLSGLEDKIDVCFNDASYEDSEAELEETIGDADMDCVSAAKAVYDIGVLAGIGVLGNSGSARYLSEVRCDEYEKHHEDLRKLKKVIRRHYGKTEYDLLFRSEEKGSYSAYVNSYNSDTTANRKKNKDVKLRRNMSNRSQEDLYKTIRGYLKDIHDDSEVQEILADMDRGTFLPKQLTSANGVIPNQIHARELKKILDNASLYLSFLTEKEGDEPTVAEKIYELFIFRIPYYVGPVTLESQEHGGNGWVVRKPGEETGMILPWNIEKKIDLTATSERFVQRLVRQCTYISGEKVLPKDSLEYERFRVLNEINNLRVDGERLPVNTKQDIYRNLYEQGRKVTRRKLLNYLRNIGLINNDAQVTGIDENLNNALLTYGKFKSIFGDHMKEDKYKELAEQIVFWCTVYGESKSFLIEQLKGKYKGVLSDDQIKKISGMKFRDWGRVSKAFLEMEGVDYSTGEAISLIQALWNTNLNLMELLNSDEYSFKKELAAKTQNTFSSIYEFKPEDLDDMYFSAPVKRMVWQTVLVIKELEKVMGAAPSRVFIEMTRSAEEKPKRKDSRVKTFLFLYKSIIKEDPKWAEIIDNADKNGTIRSKKMYLYLTQMGRDMYTGKPIDLDKLFDDNLYDIDHIYPRQFVKDDNLQNNLVLVYKPYNARKSNRYPLDEDIRIKQYGMWKGLLERNLISEEKFRRLTGNKPFDDYQMAGFIARQLVETSQGTKGVADVLKQVLPDTQIIYSKASNVSDFRHKFGIYKSRILNDNHHANDAYLNIVVGNVYFMKFTNNPMNFIRDYHKDPDKYHYNLDKMYDWNVVRNGQIAWVAGGKDKGNGTIEVVKDVIGKSTPIITRYTCEAHGSLYNATIYGRRKANEKSYYPLKTKDQRLQSVEKYGGTTSVSISYFFLVEYQKRGKRVRSIETLPIYLRKRVESNPLELEKYCENTLGMVDPVIKIRRIKNKSLIKLNGYYVRLSGQQGESLLLHNATSMILAPYWIKYIKKIEKYEEFSKNDTELSVDRNEELYQILKGKYTNTIFNNRRNSPINILESGERKFNSLTLEKQIDCLYQILSLSKIGKAVGDLSDIGGSGRTGIMSCSKNINDMQECILIEQSATGLFEKKIDLLTV